MLPARQLTSPASTPGAADLHPVAASSNKEPKADSKSRETRPPDTKIKTTLKREGRATAAPSPLLRTTPRPSPYDRAVAADAPEFAADFALAAARALVEHLHVDSYAQMGGVAADGQDRLAELEARLQTALAVPSAAGTKNPRRGTTAREAAFAFAQAFRLSALYPDTVGNGQDILATLPVPTFSTVRLARPDPAQHAVVFRALCDKTGLDEADRAAIETEAASAVQKLARRQALVGLLRDELRPDPAQGPTSADAHRFFGLLFPDHPLRPGEVEVVATQSCVYFCILSQEAFEQTETFLARGEAARAHAVDYLKRLRRFNFYNFAHFPAFTSFEAREMDPASLERLGRAMEMENAELVALLNTVVFIEERDSLEKYLIHDSWGHYWQADLTGLGALYHRMASLHLPLSPSDSVRLDDKLLSFLDLVYLRRDGSLLFDEALARRYAAAWTNERFQPLLAPVVAELAADLIEYHARAQCRAAGLELPSSSRFPQQPAKIDFAWADLSFFVKALKRVNTLYEKDAELRASFVERARLLFRLKYRRNYPAVASSEILDAELGKTLERLLAIFHEVQETDLGTGLQTTNTFSLAFVNLLRIGATLNGIVHDQLEGTRPHLAPYFQTLVMFVVKYFEREPTHGFWTLDETLAAYAVPLLESLASAERFAQDHLQPDCQS